MKRLLASLLVTSAVACVMPAPASANMTVCPKDTACQFTDPTPPTPAPAPTPGYAAPTPVEPAPGYSLSMVCKKTWTGHDYVTVDADYDAIGHLVGMRVLWSIEEGLFDRSTQYHDFRMWGGDNKAGWWGVHNTDPSETTRGDASFAPNLYYQEKHFKNGALVPQATQFMAACRPIKPAIYE
jgi:hypothetical protein